MRLQNLRLLALGAGVAFIAACDSRLPTVQGANLSLDGDPVIAIDSPVANMLVTIGDSVYVRADVRDDQALRSLSIVGYTVRGSEALGTLTRTPRFSTPEVTFSGGTRDTIVRRYLKAINVADTTADSLVVFAIARDSGGRADTARVTVNLVSGPKVVVLTPIAGQTVPLGVNMGISGTAEHPEGIRDISIHVKSDAGWPTPLDTTIVRSITGAPRSVSFNEALRVPANAPVRGRMVITVTATDVNRQPGSSAPLAITVRSAENVFPRVTQSVPTKAELSDTVTVTATGDDGIVSLGLVIRDSLGNVRRDSIILAAPFTSNVQRGVAMNLSATQQGRRLFITAYAVDERGRTGYAVPITREEPQGQLGLARVDTTTILYGRTFALARQGTISDIVVDPVRGNVFLSNTSYNRLELWQSSTQRFTPFGVAVGSAPWGLALSRNPDTVFVANSGGTNISRVFIGSTDAAAIREDLANRILTRNTFIFTVTETVEKVDSTTNRVRFTFTGPISYSDRPQFIAQSSTGRLFYSTRPTAAAPKGTIRWLDPSLPIPDPRQIWQYASKEPPIGTGNTRIYVMFNVDNIRIGRNVDPNSTASDTLFLLDHPYGASSGTIVGAGFSVAMASGQLAAQGSDVEARLDVDVDQLGLSDTTFVAASGNRNWIAFGEGNTRGAAGRIMLIGDSTGAAPNFFSPGFSVTDLMENASESVFGVALDWSGRTVASHGLQSYFSEVADPFHLRLQGKYDSFDNGTGIAFHPQADGMRQSSDATRLAFVAAASGAIEVVDIAYYINRGRMQLKHPIYGPIRVTNRFPTDPPEVILKLFALTQQGLIVVDITAGDIRNP